MDVAVKTVGEYAPELRAVANGEKSAEDFIAEELKGEVAAAGELLRLFRELLEELERRHRSRERQGEQEQPLTEV